MSDKPRIYGTCKAGCQWETVHKSDFEKSASVVEQYPQEDGSYLLEIGKEYKIYAPKTADGTAFNCVLNANEGSDYEAVFETPCNDTFADGFTFKALGFKWDEDGVCYFYYEHSGIRYSAVMGIDYETFSACKVSGATRVLLYNANATITAEKGKSAYEIAVEQGFEGTEQEWLASITKGANGATFTPSVSEDGTLSWTNDKGLENPDPVNVKGPKGDTYTLTDTDKTEIAEQAASDVRAEIDSLATTVDGLVDTVEELEKHLYLHRVYFNWYNSSKTKRVQMFILAITNSSVSLSFSGTATSTTNQNKFKNFRNACFNKTLPTMVTGSFWGNAFDYNDTYPNTPAGYIITSAKLMDHDDKVAGHEYLIITADPLARTSMDLCGEPVMHIDYNTGGTITVADDVTTLL